MAKKKYKAQTTDYLSQSDRDLVERVKARKEIDKQNREVKKAKKYLKSKTTTGKISNAAKKLAVGLGSEMRSLAKTKAVSKRVLKKNSMVVNVPEYKAPSVLGDENRFFKGELDRERRNLFFS